MKDNFLFLCFLVQRINFSCLSQCDVFLNDMTVSREHAVIEPSTGTFSIRDTNSFNGVWVNNANIEESYTLVHGDIIQIGAFCLLYQEE